eukprot:GFKZ01001952.1.p1 GENE.GFKZ01001952.1~~GFKZ01001952.1.p1  ORF type:complete len:481 (+),score=68.25 GFKZ01001952.1:50-1444(+)
MSPSLVSAVAPHRLPDATLRRQYGCFLNLAARLLGLVPSFASFAHVSPLTINFYFAALSTCFRIPLCDLGIRKITPRHRRLATLQSSISHQCRYCIAHTCLMGSLTSGSQVQQIAKAGGWHRFIGTVSHLDDVLLQLVKEACAFPAAIRAETRDRFLHVYGETAYDDVTSIVSFMAWLNYMMHSFGMQIESHAAPLASLILNTVDDSIKLDQAVANDGLLSEGQETVDWITSNKRASLFQRVLVHLRNIFDLLSLLPSVVKAIRKEAAMLAPVPKEVGALDLYMYFHMGYNPMFIRNVNDPALKRVMVFGAREIFIRDKETSWKKTERLLLLYAFGKHVSNSTLVEDAVQLIYVLHSDKLAVFPDGMDVTAESRAELQQELDVYYEKELAKTEADSRFSAAFRYVCECSRPGHAINDNAKADVVEYVKDPRSIVDIPGMIAFFGFIHRASVFCNSRAELNKERA